MSLSKTALVLVLWVSFLFPAVAQDDLLITLTPGTSNRLTLQTDPTSPDIYQIFESSLPLIGNQIDLRYPASFDVIDVTNLPGWQFQKVSLNDGSGQMVATYFYTGIDPATLNEAVNLASPLHLDFIVEDSTNSASSFTMQVEAQINVFVTDFNLSANSITFESVSPQITTSRLIEFRRANSLSLAGDDDTNDNSENSTPNLLYYAFGLGSVSEVEIDRSRLPKTTKILTSTQVSYLRHTVGDTDGISYTVECSADLETWTPVDQLPPTEQSTTPVVTPVDSDYERVNLTFPQSGVSRFYRLVVTVE